MTTTDAGKTRISMSSSSRNDSEVGATVDQIHAGDESCAIDRMLLPDTYSINP